jgi:hypothetical protein
MVKLVQLARPFVVGVVVERSAAAAAVTAAASFRDGAGAVELNLASLVDRELPAKAFFTRLDGPVYTSCRRAGFMSVYGVKFARVPIRSEEARMEVQLAALVAGSAGLDLEADTFGATRAEWTRDRGALRRQAEVVARTHRARKAVIYSWHPPHKLNGREAGRAIRALRDRGADFVKIVERVRNVAEALDSVRISLQLQEKFDLPFVFLPLGPGALRVRPHMTAFGAAYLLARPPIGSNHLPAQPPVARARALVDLS